MTEINRKLVDEYLAVGGRRVDTVRFNPFVPTPFQKDYDLGEIRRYFAQQANNKTGEIFELSKQDFAAAKLSPLYLTVSLRWKISGPAASARSTLKGKSIRERSGIVEANTTAVKQAAKKMPAIAQKLSNPFQLWRGF